MSWGERSCKFYCNNCPVSGGPTIKTCNVNCEAYEWDGVTQPDSKLSEAGRVKLLRAYCAPYVLEECPAPPPPHKETKNDIERRCRPGANRRKQLRAKRKKRR